MSSQINPELFADVEEPEEVSLSHDGLLVVYSLRPEYCRADENVVASLWMAETDKDDSTRQITRGTSYDHSATFSPDGQYIAFLSDRANPGKASDIWLLPLRGGEAFQLTPSKDEKTISSYKWKADGSTIAYLKAREETDEEKQKIKEKDDAKVFAKMWESDQLHLVNVKTHAVTLMETGDFHISQFDWAPEGNQIVFTATESSELDVVAFQGADLKIIELSSQSTRLVCSLAMPPRHLCWTHESGVTWIQCMDESTLVSAQGIFRTTLSTESKPKHLAQGSDTCAFDLRGCSGKAVAHVIKGLRDELQILPSSVVLMKEDCRIASWDVRLQGDQATVAIVRGKTGMPSEVFSFAHGKLHQLSNHGKKVAEMKIGTSLLVEDTAADGTPLDGYYCIPTDLKDDFDANNPLPTLVLVHGGPYWRAADGFSMDLFSPSWFMAQNYLVLVTNYRGGMGHGDRYAKSVRNDPSASHQDVVALVKDGIKKGHVDEKKTAIFGWSQGGYLSYLSITRDSDFHFAAAIAGAGVSDWTTMAMTSDLPTFEGSLGGNVPWLAELDWINDRKSSPIYHMQNIKTPILQLHGEDDPRVPVSQAISFHRGLRERGLDAELVIYPREGHGTFPYFERIHYIDMLKRTQKFLKKHIG